MQANSAKAVALEKRLAVAKTSEDIPMAWLLKAAVVAQEKFDVAMAADDYDAAETATAELKALETAIAASEATVKIPSSVLLWPHLTRRKAPPETHFWHRSRRWRP